MNQAPVLRRWNTVFRSLAAEPRRELIATLCDAGPESSVSLPEAAVSPDVPVDEERLRTELHHTHLPMLADNDYIEWARDPFRAARGPAFHDIATVLTVVLESADQYPIDMVQDCHRLDTGSE